MIDMESDSKLQTPNDEGLKKIAELAGKQAFLEQEIEDKESQVKALKETLKDIQEGRLPEAMDEIGISTFTLVTGEKIVVKPFYSGKIDDENRAKAFEWLRENKFGELIKHELTVPLGRGKEALAEIIKDFLEEHAVDFSDKEGIHHATLNAFIKEQVEGGQPLPLETFKAYIGRRTKITKK